MKRHIENRLKYLYSGELIAVICFVILSLLINHNYPDLKLYSLFSFWTAFLLLEFLLLQGSMYWYIKFKRFRNEKTFITPTYAVHKLIKLRKVNVLLIAIPLLAFIYDFLRLHSPFPIGGLFIALFIYVFAILEYINYFYIQLSYDNISDLRYLKQRKVLKQASIQRDINRLLHNKEKEPLK
ncbi:general stress protein [Virgibacillus sp. 7505]|uniref:general stress protein n=1 Tax=Virgibacillus sp. 7505 TaxID=2022548 RepID=UPI000BA651F5|nr:general stress protein [Virgibacillus sp. 7505]PAE15451.1 general stress protein [Virgibacillus sp. 7505]